MTREEAAKALHGSEYGEEGSEQIFELMEAAGLVAVFGASDDLMEFRGAIHDEIDACGGATAYLTPKGILENKCEDDDCPYHAKERERAATIKALWAQGDIEWTYETAIPHVTFDVMEGSSHYCRGIVFALADLPAA